MNPKEIYKTALKIDIPEDLRTSNNLDYIISKERELLSKKNGGNEEYVIGVWGNSSICGGHVVAYSILKKSEADSIIEFQKCHKSDSIKFSPLYFDERWFKRKKQRLRTKI